MSARKYFVLDTNVILHDSSCIQQFQEHDVVIPITVIEELDQFKKGNDSLNFTQVSNCKLGIQTGNYAAGGSAAFAVVGVGDFELFTGPYVSVDYGSIGVVNFLGGEGYRSYVGAPFQVANGSLLTINSGPSPGVTSAPPAVAGSGLPRAALPALESRRTARRREKRQGSCAHEKPPNRRR